MKLLEEIVELATSNREPITNVLRKCLVLAYQLNNDRLKTWAEKELDGYDPAADEIPSYRITRANAKGLFLGGFGAQIHDQPLAASVLKKEHRHWASEVKLSEPIAAYEELAHKEGDGTPQIPWPADLVAHYQENFIRGYALNRAWIEIPQPFLRSLVDSVRNRVLRFALELKIELGIVNDRAENLPPATIDRQVINIIYGGQNVIGSNGQQLIQNVAETVSENDLGSLIAAFERLGFTKQDTTELKEALSEDEQSFGEKTKAWLKNLPAKAGKAGAKIATDVATKVGTELLMQYFGIPRS